MDKQSNIAGQSRISIGVDLGIYTKIVGVIFNLTRHAFQRQLDSDVNNLTFA